MGELHLNYFTSQVGRGQQGRGHVEIPRVNLSCQTRKGKKNHEVVMSANSPLRLQQKLLGLTAFINITIFCLVRISISRYVCQMKFLAS